MEKKFQNLFRPKERRLLFGTKIFWGEAKKRQIEPKIDFFVGQKSSSIAHFKALSLLSILKKNFLKIDFVFQILGGGFKKICF